MIDAPSASSLNHRLALLPACSPHTGWLLLLLDRSHGDGRQVVSDATLLYNTPGGRLAPDLALEVFHTRAHRLAGWLAACLRSPGWLRSDPGHRACRHLGTTPGYSPTYRGFDEWLGLPYSDDMGCTDTSWPNYPKYEPVCVRANTSLAATRQDENIERDVFSDEAKKLKWPLPLYHSTSANCSGQTIGSCDRDIIEQPAELATLVREKTNERTNEHQQQQQQCYFRLLLMFVLSLHWHIIFVIDFVPFF